MSILFLVCIGKTINIYSADVPSVSPQIEAVNTSPPAQASFSSSSGYNEDYDKRTLRNHWPYLAEGKGGMGVLLGEKEAMVTRILGKATRRSFDTLDEIYYERSTFSGVVYVYKGTVNRLRYQVNENQVESLKWKTAGGLRQEMIEDLSEEDAKKVIISFYKNSKYLIKDGVLLVYSKGIGFYWGANKLRFIDIFESWHLPR